MFAPFFVSTASCIYHKSQFTFRYDNETKCTRAIWFLEANLLLLPFVSERYRVFLVFLDILCNLFVGRILLLPCIFKPTGFLPTDCIARAILSWKMCAEQKIEQNLKSEIYCILIGLKKGTYFQFLFGSIWLFYLLPPPFIFYSYDTVWISVCEKQ